jgi:hypothetical protein
MGSILCVLEDDDPELWKTSAAIENRNQIYAEQNEADALSEAAGDSG